MVEAKIACCGKCFGGEPRLVDPDKQLRYADTLWTRVNRGGRRYGFSDWQPPKEWHCKAKPRCRWRIGAAGGLNLVPHTLLVSLAVNTRVDGKVRQEHIADLGSFEGHLLPSFYSGIEPEIANSVRINVEEWSNRSIHARIWFWHRLEEKLERLSNRLSADDAAMVRSAVHKRIPQPSQEEIAQNEVWRAAHEIKSWQSLNGWYRGLVKRSEDQIADHKSAIADCKEAIGLFQPIVAEISRTAHDAELSMAKSDCQTVLSKAERRNELNLLLGKILARNVRCA